MTVKIDKNIPIPESVRESIWPFHEMEVGDSFFAPKKNSNQMANAASHWRKKKGWGFRSMNCTEPNEAGEDVAGCRVWRVK